VSRTPHRRPERETVAQRRTVAAPIVAIDDILVPTGRVERTAIRRERESEKRRGLSQRLTHRARSRIDYLQTLLAPSIEQEHDDRAVGRPDRRERKRPDDRARDNRIERRTRREPHRHRVAAAGAVGPARVRRATRGQPDDDCQAHHRHPLHADHPSARVVWAIVAARRA